MAFIKLELFSAAGLPALLIRQSFLSIYILCYYISYCVLRLYIYIYIYIKREREGERERERERHRARDREREIDVGIDIGMCIFPLE